MQTFGRATLKPHDFADALLQLAESKLRPASEHHLAFQAPWQARIFALIVSFVKDEHIAWTAFQTRLVAEIDHCKSHSSLPTHDAIEDNYFNCWLRAAELTLVAEGFLSDAEVMAKIHEISSVVDQLRLSQLHHPH
jgi:nitrile hydratase accessory protein